MADLTFTTNRLAVRYDKTAISFMAFLCLAASRTCLKYYVNRT